MPSDVEHLGGINVCVHLSAKFSERGDSHINDQSPQPHHDGNDPCSAFGHYGLVSLGELDGDETF